MAKQLKELLSALAKPIDRVIDEINNVKENRDIENATGQQLDFIKKIVVLETETTIDSDLRTEIETEIVINNSNGEFESLCLAIEKIFSPDSYRIQELDNAKIRVHLIGGAYTHGKYLAFKKAVSGGIGVFMSQSTGTPFVFSGGDGAGFGDYHIGTGVGGFFSNIVI